MTLPHRRPTLPLLCALLLSVSACARPADIDTADASFTPKDVLTSLFDTEGNSPFSSPYDGTLEFSALASKFATAHGHGYRNELKIAKDKRRTIGQTRERFSAVVTPILPDGAKTIVAQYHVDGLDTILKVYVQDTGDGRALDGRAGNGVFDIVARIRGGNGKEVETALGTVRSGDGFALDIDFENGEATVSATTASNGTRRTEPTRIQGDGRDIYFKFGDYAQALDPATRGFTSDPAKWEAWFRQHHIDREAIRFSHTRFVRD